MDISLSLETDSEDGRGEDSNFSEDGMQVIRNDPLKQRQVSPSSSPYSENKYLAGFMRSPDKTQTDAQAKQALDEDPLSLDSPFKQAVDSTSDERQGQKTGDVSGHDGSMSAQHGSPSFDSLDNAHLADMQTAADTIRNGSFLYLSQPTEAIGNNSDASPQVDTSLDAPRKGGKRSWEERRQLRETTAQAAKAYREKYDKLGDCPLSPRTQALKNDRDCQETEANRKEEGAQEKLPAPPGSNVVGQRVLSEAFCVNRLKEIRQLAGNTKL